MPTFGHSYSLLKSKKIRRQMDRHNDDHIIYIFITSNSVLNNQKESLQVMIFIFSPRKVGEFRPKFHVETHLV